ncbi:hypothetical protein H0X06_03915 [Candidatus Dependentiae bacterium]|nr:hypothetical protein [Candidatus Dependentiae bacterium]
MFTLELSRITPGNYVISNNNDNRLLCIALILSDSVLRNGTKKALYYAAEIGMENHKEFETKLYTLRLHQLDPDTILIKLSYRNSEDEFIVYETDMPLEEFINLIEEYEDAVESDVHTIHITRIQDSFELTIDQ